MDDFPALFDSGRPSFNREKGEEVKRWFRDALALSEETIVSLNQLRCRDAGCPDVESVITVLAEGRPAEIFKIWLPVEEITHARVLRAIAKSQPSTK